jgi:hypothetical protein
VALQLGFFLMDLFADCCHECKYMHCRDKSCFCETKYKSWFDAIVLVVLVQPSSAAAEQQQEHMMMSGIISKLHRTKGSYSRSSLFYTTVLKRYHDYKRPRAELRKKGRL